MPNWCDNNVHISNKDSKKIDALVKVLEENKDVFNHLCPMPEELRSTTSPNTDNAALMTEKYGYSDWYDWSVNNWGTKWDADVHSWERDGDNDVYMSFNTAWCPPIELYDKLTAEGWEINGTYIEEGMGFVGEYVYGVDNYYEYGDATSDTILDFVPEHLNEEYGIGAYMKEWEEENEE